MATKIARLGGIPWPKTAAAVYHSMLGLSYYIVNAMGLVKKSYTLI